MSHLQSIEKHLIFLLALTFISGAAIARQDSADIQSLISQLKSGNAKLKIRAAKELGRLRDKQAVEPLIACLKDTSFKNPFVRSTAAEALGEIGDPRAVEPLIAYLESKGHSAHRAAIEALEKIGDRRAVEPLVVFLNDPSIRNPLAKRMAVEALGEIGDPNAVDGIMTFLKSDRVFGAIGGVAIEVIMKLDSSEGTKYLVELWRQGDRSLRRDLSEHLIKSGKSVVEPLIEILIESNIRSRPNMQDRELYTDTIEVLGEIGDPKAVEVIVMNLGAHDFSIRNSAEKALKKLGRAAVNSLIRFLRKKVPESSGSTVFRTRRIAIKILGEIGDTRAFDILVRYLRSDNNSEKMAAIRALGRIGDTRAIPHLTRLLHDDNKDIVEAAAAALENLNYKAETERERINFLIAQQNWSQLAQMGTPAVTPLIECLNNRHYDIGSGACDALVKIGKPAVGPLLAYMERSVPKETAPREMPRGNHRSRLPAGRRPFRTVSDVDVSGNIYGTRLAIRALGEIGDSRAVEPLLEYMEKAGRFCPSQVAVALGLLGDSRAVEPLIARLNQTRMGAASALALTKLSGEKAFEYVVPLLSQWGADDELILAISRLGWRPQTEAEHVYVWVATNNKSELLSNWGQTKRILLPDLKDRYKSRRAMEFFLELKKDDPAVVNGLLSLLRAGGRANESIARTYLNCGHARLVDAAANLLVSKGNNVTYEYWEEDQYGNVKSSRTYDKETTPPDVWRRILRKEHDWKK